MNSLWERRIVRPVVGLLKQGITPEKIAFCLALGIVLGAFPVLGSTTLLCALAAFAFRLNLPAIQLVNYLVYPIQLALLLPFYRAGEWLFNAPPFPLSLKEILALIEKDIFEAVILLWDSTLYAVAAWTIIAPAVVILLYYLFKPALHRLSFKSVPASSVSERSQA